MNIPKLAAVIGLSALMALPVLAQDRKVWMGFSPKPANPVPYTGVNKPMTRLPDVLAKHKGQADWSEQIIKTLRYDVKWISMASGKKTRTQFWPDDRVIWVVWGGQIRFNIFGQKSFVAGKGFLVEVPLRVPYSMETVGTAPSLRFEVTHADRYPSFPANPGDKDAGVAPPNPPGQHYVKISYPTKPVGGGMDTYNDKNQPYLDFNKEFIEKYPSGGPRGGYFVQDADNQAAIIRGMGVPTPPPTNLGHFHVGNDEFWFILEGKIDYLIEGVGLITANQGDVVLVPPGRWHRASWAAGQMDTRLAFNRSPSMLHNFGENANGAQ